MKKARKLAGEWLPLMLLTLGTLWVIQGALAFAPGHGVIVQGLNYNAGKVVAGATINHPIRISNLSAQTVTVRVQPSCGCTVLDLPHEYLKPLHSMTISTKVSTEGITTGIQNDPILIQMKTGSQYWQRTVNISFHVI